MTISPHNQTEQAALDWAIGGLTATGWDRAEQVEYDHELAPELAAEIASLVSTLMDYRSGDVQMPDGDAARWIAEDLAYRIGEQLSDMSDSYVEQLMRRGTRTEVACMRAGRSASLLRQFAARIRLLISAQ